MLMLLVVLALGAAVPDTTLLATMSRHDRSDDTRALLFGDYP